MSRTVRRSLPTGLAGFAFTWHGSLTVVLSRDISSARAQAVATLLGLQSGAFRVVADKRTAVRRRAS